MTVNQANIYLMMTQNYQNPCNFLSGDFRTYLVYGNKKVYERSWAVSKEGLSPHHTLWSLPRKRGQLQNESNHLVADDLIKYTFIELLQKKIKQGGWENFLVDEYINILEGQYIQKEH